MKKGCITTALAICLAAGPAAAYLEAQQTQPDNTLVNRNDRAAGQPTADQGKNNAYDRQLAEMVRNSIVRDKDLSSYAHNIKVIAQHGTVTLKGPVRSEDERRAIVQKATDAAGAGNVVDQLTIKAARQKKS